MTNRNTRRGFTLIELLVVVLIIGVLAAIALPQYQVAAGKSQVIRFMPFIKAIEQAEQVYYLAHGEYTAYFSKLDVSLTGGKPCEGTAGYNCRDYGNWRCMIAGGESASINCKSKSLDVALSRAFGSSGGHYWACWAGEENSLRDKICSSVSRGGSRNHNGAYVFDKWK